MGTTEPLPFSSLSDTLPQLLSKYANAPSSVRLDELRGLVMTGELRAKRQRWVHLDHSTVLVERWRRGQAHFREAHFREAQGRLNAAQTHRLRLEVQRLEDAVKDGVERDTFLTERPADCWCFGFGGKTLMVVPLKDGEEDTWDVCCPYCPEGQDAQDRKEALYAAYQNHSSVLPAAGWDRSGIPSLHLRWRLETHPYIAEHLDLFAELMEPTGYGSWFFYGETGTGKTGLAIGYAWEWRQRFRGPILFCSLPDLITELKATFGRNEGPSERDVIDRYAHAPFWIADDMGAEQLSAGEWLETRLYQIIASRHANGLGTVFTSNLDLGATTGRIGERLIGRIVEMCGGGTQVREIAGPDLRMPVEGE